MFGLKCSTLTSASSDKGQLMCPLQSPASRSESCTWTHHKDCSRQPISSCVLWMENMPRKGWNVSGVGSLCCFGCERREEEAQVTVTPTHNYGKKKKEKSLNNLVTSVNVPVFHMYLQLNCTNSLLDESPVILFFMLLAWLNICCVVAHLFGW